MVWLVVGAGDLTPEGGRSPESGRPSRGSQLEIDRGASREQAARRTTLSRGRPDGEVTR